MGLQVDLQDGSVDEELPRYERQDYAPHPSSLPGKLRAEVYGPDNTSSRFSTVEDSTFNPGPTVQESSRRPVTYCSEVHPFTSAMDPSPPPPVLLPPSRPTTPHLRPILTVQIPGSAPSRASVPVVYEPVPAPLPAAYRQVPQPQHLGKHPAHVQCPSCNAFQETRTSARSGDYTMMVSIMMGIFTCLWCVPYALNSCKDVEHACANCGEPLALWHRQNGKVELLGAALHGNPTNSTNMRPISRPYA